MNKTNTLKKQLIKDTPFNCLRKRIRNHKPETTSKEWKETKRAEIKRKKKPSKKKKLRDKFIKKMSYKEYIRSFLWKERRRKYYKEHEKKCIACGSIERVALHHLTYRRLKKEKDEDLAPLCWYCHSLYHEKYGTKDLEDLSNAFIIERNEEVEFDELVKTL